MPTGIIPNRGGVYGQAATPEQEIKFYINGSAGTLKAGDVVVHQGVAGTHITTTTTASDNLVAGVVAEPEAGGAPGAAATAQTHAVGAIVPVVVAGIARVQIAAEVVIAGDFLVSTTAAKVAGADATPVAGQGLGIALEATAAADALTTIRAMIKLV